MNHIFDKKLKKPLKSSQRLVPLGVPTNIAVGPLGFHADLDIDPKGEQTCCHRDFEIAEPDPTVLLDEKDTRAGRIVFQENKDEDRGLASATGVSTASGGIGHGGNPASECFRILRLGQTFISWCICLLERDTGETGEQGVASRGTCRCHYGYRVLLTPPRSEEGLDENGTWSRCHYPRPRTGSRRGIRSSQSRPGAHHRHL